MATSTSLCAAYAIPSCATSLSLHQLELNPVRLSFPFNFVPRQAANLALKFDPLHFKVYCARGNKGKSKLEIPPKPDPVYRNRLINMFVNRILKNGKKSLAYHIIYQALTRIQNKTGSNPLVILREAMLAVTPDVAVKAKRVGGTTQQIPIEVGAAQGRALAIRWILNAARKRQGQSMIIKLSSELLDAANGTGDAVRRKEETHKMAEANRAFAHFR